MVETLMNDTYYTTSSKRTRAWDREQIKIIFQYAVMLVASWVAGWLLPHFFSETLWQMARETISTHFELPFSSLTNLHEVLLAVYGFFKPTLICIGLVGIFSFSSLNCLATDCVLVYLGMRTGCTVSVLYAFSQDTAPLSYHTGAFRLFVFILFKLLVLVFFAVYAVRTAKLSYRLRVYSQEGRTLFHPQTVWALLLQIALCALFLFALHLLYGYSICLVSK